MTLFRWLRLWALCMFAGLALAGCFGDDDDDGGDGTGTGLVAAPTITTAPAALAVAEGATGTFSVVAEGPGPLTYQWLRNGTAIADATGASYTTAPATAADNGALFSVTVSNPGGSTTSATAALTVNAGARGTLSGRVQSAADGQGLAGAVVEVGGLSTTTGADGSFTLQAPAGLRAVARVQAPGHAPSVRIASIVAGQSTTMTAQLLPVGSTTSVTLANGGDATVSGSTARVSLAPGSLVRSDGGTAAASVNVSLTPIDPSVNPQLMPGDFTAGSAAAPQLIESFGALQIDIRDASGAAYNLAAGRTATLRIPLGTRSPTPPATVPLFFMNEATGRWVQEGSATLQGTMPNQYYEGSVTHFSTWNADQVAETVRLSGCVRDAAGQPVANAQVLSDGIDYSGSSRAVSGADGLFVIEVKRGGLLTLSALAGDRLTNTLRVQGTTTAADATVAECLVTSFTTAGVSAKLTWGTLPEDVDSYMLAPDGTLVWYGNPGSLASAPYVALDVDDTTSFGPEVITVTRLMQGTYRYLVNNYDETFNPGLTGSPVRVELNRGGALTLFSPPAGEGSNLWWHVFDLVVDANCAVSVVPVNTWSATAPAAPAAPATPPALCQPR
ncbi:carboxypeptidase regulatory-like domain-containing protein [Aquincola tertiaricarbonis]|uniref:carboxypeptidase regulatory-like domain-containing protein n=1 Tax=Aquincola tertiaricarbonis TaxID=391953 RepID=UPI00069805CE|nr:carboxypeptidase regulatory-like domain-containing protein [Aquincola tertiaricarbonis]